MHTYIEWEKVDLIASSSLKEALWDIYLVKNLEFTPEGRAHISIARKGHSYTV